MDLKCTGTRYWYYEQQFRERYHQFTFRFRNNKGLPKTIKKLNKSALDNFIQFINYWSSYTLSKNTDDSKIPVLVQVPVPARTILMGAILNVPPRAGTKTTFFCSAWDGRTGVSDLPRVRHHCQTSLKVTFLIYKFQVWFSNFFFIIRPKPQKQLFYCSI